MIKFVPLSESGHTHFAEDLYESAFPESERPDFDSLKERNRNFRFLVALNDKEPIGILTYWTFEEFVYIEHFAIDEDLRDQGFGKAVFLNFLSRHTEQVILEVELPHDETSEHRLEFYTSMGLCQNPQEYWQPSYENPEKLEMPMLILSKMELDDDEFLDVRNVLYSNVYKYTSKIFTK